MKKSNSKKIGMDFEEQFIKTINSGAFFHDGDASSNLHVLEIKGTRKGKGFRITTKMLNKIWGEAFDNNKFPMFGVIIEDEKDIWTLKIEINKKRK